MRPADMAAIAEAMKNALGESPHDLLARVERDLERRGYALPHARRDEPERCARCGGLKHDQDHELSSDAVCRCGGRVRRLRGYLDAVDPGRRMTLDSLDASEPTLAAALGEASGIAVGERRKGMLLMGPPGRGKTHLMVGLGRELLGRERDAGYYNVVRLVSRIQDTYGEHSEVGDTRRAIVESVASHEVVLLDDLGKEHASTNVESIVYELFDALYAARVTLVVATNVPAARGGRLQGAYPVRALRRGGSLQAQGHVRAVRRQGRGSEASGPGVVSVTDRPEERANHRGPAEALVALAQLVVAGADFRRLTRETARATAIALSADRCEVLRLAPDGGRLLRVAVSGEGATQDDDTGAVPSGVSSAAGYALLCGAPILSRNLEEDRRFGTAGAPPWGSPVSAVAAPVPGRASGFGALVVYAARPGAFDERHTLSAARTASLLGGALERLSEQEELRRRAEEAERRLDMLEEPGEAQPIRETPGLTERRVEILGLMAEGRSAKQIGSELGLSIHTVHSHQRNLYRALGVGSFAAALKRAAELGLLGS